MATLLHHTLNKPRQKGNHRARRKAVEKLTADNADGADKFKKIISSLIRAIRG
jgi:hypothetical protein